MQTQDRSARSLSSDSAIAGVASHVTFPAEIATAHENVAITSQRPIPVDLDQALKNPGAARAKRAASREMPNGSTDIDEKYDDYGTVVMQHCRFFDRNNTGVISPLDTYSAFRRMGFNFPFSVAAAAVIHVNFAYFTQDSWIPDPRLLIYVKNIHKAMHGSDQKVYDPEGRFIPQKMEEIFTKFDRDDKKGLDFWDMMRATNACAKVFDFYGWTAAKLEWGVLWLLCKDENGIVTKEQIRRCYDGTVFYHAEKEYNERKALEKIE